MAIVTMEDEQELSICRPIEWRHECMTLEVTTLLDVK